MSGVFEPSTGLDSTDLAVRAMANFDVWGVISAPNRSRLMSGCRALSPEGDVEHRLPIRSLLSGSYDVARRGNERAMGHGKAGMDEPQFRVVAFHSIAWGILSKINSAFTFVFLRSRPSQRQP